MSFGGLPEQALKKLQNASIAPVAPVSTIAAGIPLPSATGQYTLPLPKADPKADKAYALGDPTYLGVKNQLDLQKSQLLSAQTREKGLTLSNALEQKNSLNKQSGVDLKDLMAGFAARGTLYSGTYANTDSRTRDAYAQRLAAVDKNVADTTTDQQTALKNFNANYALGTQQALQQAAQRRLAGILGTV